MVRPHLFTHVGRWPKGAKPADYKYAHCSVRSPRWHLVCDTKDGSKQWQLFDVKADPGEKTDVAAGQPEVVKELDAAYDKWWDSVQPGLVNEHAVGPKVNPFKELYEKQFAGQEKKNDGAAARTVKVFILAGQSNMEGKAPNTLLDHQATDAKTRDLFAHLRKDDKWIVRDDVFIKFLDRKGPLTIGYGSPGRTGRRAGVRHRDGQPLRGTGAPDQDRVGRALALQDTSAPPRPATPPRRCSRRNSTRLGRRSKRTTRRTRKTTRCRRWTTSRSRMACRTATCWRK